MVRQGSSKKMLQSREKEGKCPRKLANHRNTAVIKFSSAGKLYRANQRVDSNSPG